MTRERLESLPLSSLLDIAVKEGIAAPEGIDRETLIEEIQEALEEDRDEREQSNNSAMRIKEKKYDVVQDEELEAQEKTDYPLPDRYNETRIVALLRDPLWAFAYWDLNFADIEPLQSSPETNELFLRVHDTPADAAGDGGSSFDIPVKLGDSSWYINLPNPGESYWIELCWSDGEREHTLCRSNTVKSPLGAVALDYLHDMLDGAESDVLTLAGLTESTLPSFRDKIPQRILSMVDDDYPGRKR